MAVATGTIGTTGTATEPRTATPVLETRGLSKSFGGVDAVIDVDISVPEHEVRALIGPNGAGKSTFTGLVVGRMEPTRGSVRFDGRDITALAAHERIRLGIAYTFQITSVFAELDVRENVALAVRRAVAGLNLGRRARPRQVRQRVDEALERVGLQARTATLAGDLAYGHQRLLEIAMGLAQAPRLFIMDEPTQGLAPDETERFVALVRELSASTTILLIEHNMPVVMACADRISVLEAGRLLAEGTPAEIRANEAVQAAYLGREVPVDGPDVGAGGSP